MKEFYKEKVKIRKFNKDMRLEQNKTYSIAKRRVIKKFGKS
jgi:hypothetical protein